MIEEENDKKANQSDGNGRNAQFKLLLTTDEKRGRSYGLKLVGLKKNPGENSVKLFTISHS
jgi:hypothetical protein